MRFKIISLSVSAPPVLVLNRTAQAESEDGPKNLKREEF
jgi:hypothetical protein